MVGGGGPELTADGGRVAQVFDGFEERDGLEAGVGAVGTAVWAAAAFDADTAETREPEDVEDIFGGGGSADDVAGEGFGDVDALQFGDGAEGVEDFAGLRGEGGRKGEVVGGFFQDAWGLGQLGDGGGVDARVLADVQRLQVQAVGADLKQQRVDEQPARGGGHGCARGWSAAR